MKNGERTLYFYIIEKLKKKKDNEPTVVKVQPNYLDEFSSNFNCFLIF